VELMIRVAAGEKLPLAQADVKLNGWSVESRVYAEDPTRGFLPSTGRLVTYRPPAEGPMEGGAVVRNDTGVYEGGEISIYYDPMIAKLVTHAPTRTAAIDAQARALDAFAIDGIRHNIPFLSAVMTHPRWREGRLSTGFIAEEFPDGFSEQPPTADGAEVMAAVAAAIDHLMNERKRGISGQKRPNAVRFERDRVVILGGERHELPRRGPSGRRGDGLRGRDTTRRRLVLAPGTAGLDRHGRRRGRGHAGPRHPERVPPVRLRQGGRGARLYAPEAELAALMPEKSAAGVGKALLCPMPGLVKAIQVKAGQDVKAGEPLAIVEAMKMENVLRAERDATIAKVVAREGESLAVDAVILEFA
jgi:propionyl-CoA carboxylase alpha chain